MSNVFRLPAVRSAALQSPAAAIIPEPRRPEVGTGSSFDDLAGDSVPRLTAILNEVGLIIVGSLSLGAALEMLLAH